MTDPVKWACFCNELLRAVELVIDYRENCDPGESRAEYGEWLLEMDRQADWDAWHSANTPS